MSHNSVCNGVADKSQSHFSSGQHEAPISIPLKICGKPSSVVFYALDPFRTTDVLVHTTFDVWTSIEKTLIKTSLTQCLGAALPLFATRGRATKY